MATMGYEWAAWTGPYQFAFGAICMVAGLGLGLFALLPPPSERPVGEAGLAWDQLSLKDAGLWLYNNAGPSFRETIRRGVPSPFASIAEHTEAMVMNAAMHHICPVLVQWEPGLPWEKVDPAELEFGPFEQVFGSDRPRPFGVAVLRSDLPRILSYYEDE